MAQVLVSHQAPNISQSKPPMKRKRADKETNDDDSSVRKQSTPARKSAAIASSSLSSYKVDKEPRLQQTSQTISASSSPYFSPPDSTQGSQRIPDLTPYLKKIALSTLTPFQKRVLTALCQVPPGEHTTYGALAKHLSSSPRAVGNALRDNPFAPQVPCHRVLASGGRLGGFKGSWGRGGEKGKNDDHKMDLLREEGVLFGPKGLVVGRVWEGFR